VEEIMAVAHNYASEQGKIDTVSDTVVLARPASTYRYLLNHQIVSRDLVLFLPVVQVQVVYKNITYQEKNIYAPK